MCHSASGTVDAYLMQGLFWFWQARSPPSVSKQLRPHPRPRLLPTPTDIRIIANHYSIPSPIAVQHESPASHPRAPKLLANARARLSRLSRTHAIATGLMNAVIARSPLQPLPTAMNRPTTRRRSVRHAFEDDDAPVAKRAKTEVNGAGKKAAGGATKKAAKAGELVFFFFAWRCLGWSRAGMDAVTRVPDA